MSNELRDRLERASRLLVEMIPNDPAAAARVRGKAEGVRLALSYLDEEGRTISGDDYLATVERQRAEALATIERVKALMDEEYRISLCFDQGHVQMSAEADGMRLVIAHIRVALESPAEQKLVM